MAKNKKGKVVPFRSVQFSPEKYIQTQARSLPIFECLVSKDWQNTGICNVIVSRRHVTGNLTVGVYLVDLYCLGVKNAMYEFNMDPEAYKFLAEHSGEIEKCDYTLAHNIVYGAIEFADDYGFKPHKDFSIAQYILEEDDERVELIDIEFGLEGAPCYMQGPNETPAQIQNIKNTLMRTAGEGSFKVVEDDEFDDDEFDDDEFDEDWFDEDEEDEESLSEQEEILEDLLYTVKPVNKFYDKALRTEEGRELLKKSGIGKGYRLTENPVESQYDLFADANEETEYGALRKLFDESELKPAIKGLKKAINTYPNSARFYNLLQACYFFSDQQDKSNELTLEMYKRFPGYMFALVPYANMLISDDKPEEALAVFSGKADLNELYPGRKQFNRHEATIYYATMCRCYVALDNIDYADLYMNAIFKKDLQHMPGQTLVNNALRELCGAKIKKIRVKVGWDG